MGRFIGHADHHEHGAGLVAAHPLPGLTPRQQAVAAEVVRRHRLDAPPLACCPLPDDDRAIVARLAALLRLADALDAQHAGKVRRAAVTVEPDRITVRLEGEGDLLLERWMLARKASLFEEVFGRSTESA